MKNKAKGFDINVGTSSILLIFVTLSLVSFATLSLVSANADYPKKLQTVPKAITKPAITQSLPLLRSMLHSGRFMRKVLQQTNTSPR